MGRPNRGKSRCKRKKRYTDVNVAATDAIKLFLIPDVWRVRVYPCPWCGFLHVTRGNGHRWVWEAQREQVGDTA